MTFWVLYFERFPWYKDGERPTSSRYGACASWGSTGSHVFGNALRLSGLWSAET